MKTSAGARTSLSVNTIARLPSSTVLSGTEHKTTPFPRASAHHNENRKAQVTSCARHGHSPTTPHKAKCKYHKVPMTPSMTAPWEGGREEIREGGREGGKDDVIAVRGRGREG